MRTAHSFAMGDDRAEPVAVVTYSRIRANGPRLAAPRAVRQAPPPVAVEPVEAEAVEDIDFDAAFVRPPPLDGEFPTFAAPEFAPAVSRQRPRRISAVTVLAGVGVGFAALFAFAVFGGGGSPRLAEDASIARDIASLYTVPEAEGQRAIREIAMAPAVPAYETLAAAETELAPPLPPLVPPLPRPRPERPFVASAESVAPPAPPMAAAALPAEALPAAAPVAAAPAAGQSGEDFLAGIERTLAAIEAPPPAPQPTAVAAVMPAPVMGPPLPEPTAIAAPAPLPPLPAPGMPVPPAEIPGLVPAGLH